MFREFLKSCKNDIKAKKIQDYLNQKCPKVFFFNLLIFSSLFFFSFSDSSLVCSGKSLDFKFKHLCNKNMSLHNKIIKQLLSD